MNRPGALFIDPQRELWSLNFLSGWSLGAGFRWLGRHHFQIVHRSLRLLAQLRREHRNAGEEVVAFFLPAELDDLIVLRIDHRGKIAWCVVIKVQPGLGIGAPCMLNFQKQVAEQCNIGRVAESKVPVSQPALPQPRNFAIACQFQRIAGDTVYPRVANLVGQHRQRGAVRLNCIRNLGQVRRNDCALGNLKLKAAYV